MEYGLTGPTAVKDIDPTGTGVSDVAAAFITANCSPFTNPRDFPCPAKVPDPRNTQNTSTMFIWSHFDIPAVGGDQLVISSADPLAPVPIIWGGGNAVDDNTTKCNPNVLANLYESHHCSDMVYQMRELGRRSKQYRVVGHGLKVWVSKNTQVSRGSIEAGQFNYADSRNFTNSDPTNWTSSTALPSGTNTTLNWTNAPGLSNDVGWQGMSLQCRDIARYRSMLSAAKDQEVGFLAADEGCTIRWTDTNEFAFQTTTDRGCVFPYSYSYGNRGYMKYETANANNLGDVASANTSVQFYPAYNDDRGTAGALLGQLVTVDTYKQLGSLNYFFQDTVAPFQSQGYYQKMSVQNGSTSRLPMHAFYGQGDRETTQMVFNLTDATFASYCQDPHKAFDKGLFADITGLDPSQVLTVQVCWHIEYVPKGVEPWDSQPSPVDTSFDMISAMCRDRKAFPIVTKGHSFFSSLRKALSKAFSAIGSIVSSSAPAIAAGLSAVPDPRAQAGAAAVSMLGGFASAFKRPRLE